METNKELIDRYISGTANPEEKKAVTQWINANPDNMREFLEMRKLYDISIWQEESEKNISSAPVTKSSVIFFRQILKVAAILVIILGSVYWLTDLKMQKLNLLTQTIHVPAGQRAELILSDGTKVWLNAQTTFTFPLSFSSNSRQVKLNGEGYFKVARNESKPFIVQTEKYNVRVLGTEFNLIAYDGSNFFETALLKGSVEVYSENKKNSEKVYLARDTKVCLSGGKLIKAPINQYNHFLWREGLLSFENESFKDIIDKLQLYYDMEFVINNKDALNNRYTGKFRLIDGVEHVLKVLQLNKDFTFQKDDERNVISIN